MPKFGEVLSTTGKVLLALFLIALGIGALYSIIVARSFLYSAYIATWLIHGLYLASLARRYRRLRQMKDLVKGRQ